MCQASLHWEYRHWLGNKVTDGKSNSDYWLIKRDRMQNNPTVDPLLHSTNPHPFLFHHIQTYIHFYKQDWNQTYNLYKSSCDSKQRQTKVYPGDKRTDPKGYTVLRLRHFPTYDCVAKAKAGCMVRNVSKHNVSFSLCDLKGPNADSAPKSIAASLKIVQ